MLLLSFVDFFYFFIFFKNLFQEHSISLSNGLYQDQDGRSVSPYMVFSQSLYCLQRFTGSADGKRRVKT